MFVLAWSVGSLWKWSFAFFFFLFLFSLSSHWLSWSENIWSSSCFSHYPSSLEPPRAGKRSIICSKFEGLLCWTFTKLDVINLILWMWSTHRQIRRPFPSEPPLGPRPSVYYISVLSCFWRLFYLCSCTLSDTGERLLLISLSLSLFSRAVPRPVNIQTVSLFVAEATGESSSQKRMGTAVSRHIQYSVFCVREWDRGLLWNSSPRSTYRVQTARLLHRLGPGPPGSQRKVPSPAPLKLSAGHRPGNLETGLLIYQHRNYIRYSLSQCRPFERLCC